MQAKAKIEVLRLRRNENWIRKNIDIRSPKAAILENWEEGSMSTKCKTPFLRHGFHERRRDNCKYDHVKSIKLAKKDTVSTVIRKL